MKSSILLCFVFAVGALNAQTVSLSQQQQEKAKQYTEECIKESGVKPEIIAAAKKGQLTEDEGLKKFTLCFFQKTGILTPDAKLDVDVALSKLPSGINKADAKKVLEACKDKTGKTPADTAFAMFKCYRQDIKTHIDFGF